MSRVLILYLVLNSPRRTSFLVRKPSFVYTPLERSSFRIPPSTNTNLTGSSLIIEYPLTLPAISTQQELWFL